MQRLSAFHTAQALFLGFGAVSAVLVIALITWKYRGADPVGRRQVKWVVYGFFLAATLQVVGNLLTLGHPDPSFSWKIFEVAEATTIFVPLSILIAMVRFNLFDIDRLISATAAYTVAGIAAPASIAPISPQGLDNSKLDVTL